jgi:hypothetical protein
MHTNRTWRFRPTRHAKPYLRLSMMSASIRRAAHAVLGVLFVRTRCSLLNNHARNGFGSYASRWRCCWPVNASAAHSCSCSRHPDRREALGGSVGSARITIYIVILLRLTSRPGCTPSFVRSMRILLIGNLRITIRSKES